MLRHIQSRAPGGEVSHDSGDVSSLPPPPPRNPSNGPDTRRHSRIPPALNTALPYASGPQHLSNTLATPSSLSSPFTLSNPNTGNALVAGGPPGPGSRGVSPANHRLSGNFANMAYNPQEWASGRQSVESRQRRDCYGEPLNTPPPPYAGQHEQRPSINPLSRSVAYESPEISRTNTPLQHEGLHTSDPSQQGRQRPTVITSMSQSNYDPRRKTQPAQAVTQEYNPAASIQQYRPNSVQGQSSSSLSFQAGTRASQEGGQLPPPPPRKTLATFESNSDPRDSLGSLTQGRRSTSAGPTPTAAPLTTRTTRTLSGDARSQSSMALPGPPQIPPPSKFRCSSAHTNPESDLENTDPRPHSYRSTLRKSNLTPIPATPASIASGVSPRPMPFPLRIDTGLGVPNGKAPVVMPQNESQEPPINRNSQAGPSSLARRSAVRGPAARIATGGRSRSKDQSGNVDNQEPPSTTLSNNPWASALESAKSPMEESLPESAILPGMGATLGGRSHTPPATPSTFVQKQLGDQIRPQPKVLPTPPLSQKPLLSANSANEDAQVDIPFVDDTDNFVKQSMERHQAFIRREQQALTDMQRLSLFMQFVHQESLIRKERYPTAFKSEEFDIEAAKNMLFNGSKVRRASTRDDSVVDPTSPVVAKPNGISRPDNTYFKDYRPQLSPIASMDYDEQSSRGRAPSRWWESHPGSNTDGQGQEFTRSKRESKYMSLSKKLLQDMESGEMDPLPEHSPWAFGQAYPDEKANPETFGFYDDMTSPAAAGSSQRRAPKPSQLDISRFVTLPPPYPRHHPAVNNSHPDLADYRATVRMFGDMTDAKSRQARHQISVEAMKNDRASKIKELRKAFRANIQSQIADGNLSYAEAADAERLVKSDEFEVDRQGLQAEFDTLQDVVINPLHDQFNERVQHLTNSLEALERELVSSAVNPNPDQPVQEGDDVPELLEQLTQLKWLFEAREASYQELFGLLTQRNDAYKAIVALPYSQTGNIDKVRDTEAFFDKDAAMRHATFCAESLKRHEAFLQFVEDNALRGVEVQSSAFWDITPGLVALMQKIPTDLSKLDIQIPDDELEENPSFGKYPQQYLYHLLQHAEKSSYQYIEGQVNLHCLVHEVKTSSLAAHYRASKAQQRMAGDLSIDLADTRMEDEGELTEELKNRATMIEQQWHDALGHHFQTLGNRVTQNLQAQGAWEDIVAAEAA